MLSLDRIGIEKILLQIEKFINTRYKFLKVNNELSLLGAGGFSYVYEMYDEQMPEKHYAGKIIGLGNKDVSEDLIFETTQIQYFLSEQSENIMRVFELWTMKLALDEVGNVTEIIGVNEEGYDSAEGGTVQVVLMEKLECVLSKDKYGNVELNREELKTEEGVLRFAEDIGHAIFTVHNNGFLHRDIKLENIFWDSDLQQYKLGDFGIAKYVGEGDAETVVFSDGYGAPEIERQLAESYNLTADIYSFGITLFLLLNELRFPASDSYRANVVQYSKDFIVPAPVNASEELAKIIREMCSYNVEDRYQSVEEVLMDIGTIDGNYSENGFTEYEDLETETYREVDDNPTETYRDDQIEEQDDKREIQKIIPRRRKKERELTREEWKKKVAAANKRYNSSSIWRMILTAIFSFCLLKSFVPDAPYVSRWELWILPLAVLVEAVLQRIKEFHIEFGFITIGIAVFSMHYLGAGVPQIAAIIALLVGIPAITAGFSLGMFLWIAQILFQKYLWLNFLNKWDLGWLAIVLLVVFVERYIIYRDECNKLNRYEIIVFLILNFIWLLMIITGVILLILSHFHVVSIPEAVKHIHLIRSGICLVIIGWFFTGVDDEDEEVDESLDE